jgi:superfamily II DNA/RNA helicase
VLDEADKMLDMGFYEDILRIIKFVPEKRQNLLFSATMPPRMRELAKKIMRTPIEISIAISQPAAGILQQAVILYDNQKKEVLKKIITEKHKDSVLIFASTKIAVKELEKELKQLKLPARAIHSDLTQEERENVLLSFKNKSTKILVATDILSRGIDIEDIALVVNYDVPGDAEDYIHRIGRTARAAAKGEAITFVNERDQKKFAQIEKLMDREVEKITLPESMGSQPAWNPELKIKQEGSFRRKYKKPFRKKGNG